MNPDEAVGKRIEDLRSSQGLSQGQLSDLVRAAGLNWSQGTVSRVEAGTRPVRFTEAFTVAKALGAEVVALAPAGGGLEYAYQQDLDAVVDARRHLRTSEQQVTMAVARSHLMRFAVELSEGKRGPYIVHSSRAAITHWLARHLRTPPEGALGLLGIPEAVASAELERAQNDADAIEASGLDPEWDGPDYAPNLGEWIRHRVESDGLDPNLPESLGWANLLGDLSFQLHAAATTSLWDRYFPFVTEDANVRNASLRYVSVALPIVDGIDVTEIDEQLNLPIPAPPSRPMELLNGW